jgi:hypothetical protein
MRRLISLGIGHDLNPEASTNAVQILPPQPYPLRSCIVVLGGHIYELVDRPDVLDHPTSLMEQDTQITDAFAAAAATRASDPGGSLIQYHDVLGVWRA